MNPQMRLVLETVPSDSFRDQLEGDDERNTNKGADLEQEAQSDELGQEIERHATVLVVDDNAQNRGLARAQLLSAGFDVYQAEDGKQALEAFQAYPPDVVLLDVLMPGMDGFETCRRLRALKGGRDVPIVLITAMADSKAQEKAIESGADDFLTKPINRTELLMRVRSLVRIKRLQTELTEGYELIVAQRDLLAKTQEQKDELVSLVAHDLKSPLTSLRCNLEYLRTKVTQGEDETEALGDALSAVEQMHNLVLNMLDVNRSEHAELTPNLTLVELPHLIGEVEDGLKQRLKVTGQRLEVTLDEETQQIWGDRDLLKRILENLLDNCLRYAPSDGTIGIELRTRDGAYIQLRVRDQGPGVPAEFREKIFEKYAQLKSGAQHHSRGNRGLGLAFCRLAVQAHHGRIWVEDNQPKGSCFCVELPIGGPKA